MLRPVRRSSLVYLGAALLVALGMSGARGTATEVPETCQGEPATLVGRPGQRQLTGTDGVDVVITGGAGAVTTLSGDDLVCVTGMTGEVWAGDGNDHIVTGDAAVETVTDLGAGDDQFAGGERRDIVRPGPGTDQIDTGGGSDSYDGSKPVEVNSDQVSLGSGPDRALVTGSNLAGVLDGGGGLNTLALGDCCEVEHAWVVDNETQTATQDGVPAFQWRAFRGFDFAAFSVTGTLMFHGSDAAERVRVSQEFEFGPDIELLDLRGGNDRVTFFGTLGPVRAGEGDDRLRLDGFADERSFALERRFQLDLDEGWMRSSGHRPRTEAADLENAAVSEFAVVDIRV